MTTTRFAVLILIGSVGLVGCAPLEQNLGYRAVPLQEKVDPLAPEKDFPVWNPPKQFAVWIHPHRDRDQRTMIGGHWSMLLLSEGSWYFEEGIEQEPIPDAEISGRDLERARASLLNPGEAAIPYRLMETPNNLERKPDETPR